MKLILYLPQILLSVVAIFLIVRCFVSLFSMRPAGRPKAILMNRESGKKLAISTYEASLGRAKNCDIQLVSSMASRAHAVISRRKSGWFITDTDSKTGTYVNGTKIQNSTELFHGDMISIGGVEYTFIAPHASRDGAPAPQAEHAAHQVPASPPAPQAGLINCATDFEYPIQGGILTIGRSETNNVVISDATVSRNHALIHLTDEGWVVTDRDSTAGVGVNGYKVHGSQPIEDGDTIMINTHNFIFREHSAERRGAHG